MLPSISRDSSMRRLLRQKICSSGKKLQPHLWNIRLLPAKIQIDFSVQCESQHLPPGGKFAHLMDRVWVHGGPSRSTHFKNYPGQKRTMRQVKSSRFLFLSKGSGSLWKSYRDIFLCTLFFATCFFERLHSFTLTTCSEYYSFIN